MPVRRNAHGNWFYRKRVKLPDGSKVDITGTPTKNTKLAAEQAERAHIDRVLDPQTVTARKEVPRFEEFGKRYVDIYAATNNKPSEVSSKRSILAQHLVPVFGKLRLDQIGIREIEEYKARKLADLDPKTINNHLTCLRRLFAVAVEWNELSHVPPVKWLRVPAQKFDFFTFEEAERLIAGADGEWRAMITVALKTGLRMGELLALRWEDVDLTAGRLVVRQAAARGIIGTPKSHRSREVPLSPDAVATLKAHRHLRGPLVFCDGEGQLLTPASCRRPLWRASKRAGLRLVGWHVLRHTFASHLVMHGASVKSVQELLGHSTLEMTMRYAHLSPDVKRDAVALLDRRCISVASESRFVANT